MYALQVHTICAEIDQYDHFKFLYEDDIQGIRLSRGMVGTITHIN